MSAAIQWPFQSCKFGIRFGLPLLANCASSEHVATLVASGP